MSERTKFYSAPSSSADKCDRAETPASRGSFEDIADMSLRDKIAALDLPPADRKRMDEFLDEQDRTAIEHEKKWGQYARIKHEYGAETADIALSMLNVRRRGHAVISAWDIAAQYAHKYLVATSAHQ